MVQLQAKSVKQPQMRGIADKVFQQMFEDTCQSLEKIDGRQLSEKTWTRDDKGVWVEGETTEDTIYIDRTLSNGNVFEKVGINYVAINGELPPGMTLKQSGALATSETDKLISDRPTSFFASGASFVIHPQNPMIPTAHANYRYFQIGDGSQPGSWWFGGGADLTPAYLFEEDAVHFHQIHKQVCDLYDPSYYPRFKKSCDDYFHIPHRRESRGIGGIFFDYLQEGDIQQLLAFVTDCTQSFVPAYMPIVEKRQDLPFTEVHKHWQRIVRGRYVEFILTSDRGIRFGLASGMVNAQSVFNCMPPGACWEYDDRPVTGSQEAKLRELLQNPTTWV